MVAQRGFGVPERIQRLKDSLLSRRFQVDFERAKWFTRVYARTEGQTIGAATRAALALQETFRNMPIRIEDDELIVGSKSAKDWGDPIYIEMTTSQRELSIPAMFYNYPEKVKEAFPEGIGSLSAERLEEFAHVSKEDYQLLTQEILPYWKDKTVHTLMVQRWKAEGLLGEPSTPAMDGGVVGTYKHLSWIVANTSDLISPVMPMQGHLAVGLRKVLKLGFNGIALQAKEQLEEFRRGQTSEEFNQTKDFLEAVQLSARAAVEFSKRYTALAEEMARRTEGRRRAELLEIAERCRRVPAEPPRTFVEALQAIWLTQAMVMIAYGGASITCPGRVDQLLFPYYRQDTAAGRMTREEALEAIMEYYVKLATNIYVGPNNVTIGGIDRNGECAVNEVSYLFLEAHDALRACSRNGLAVRFNLKTTPRDFILKACEVHRRTGGIAFYNDDVIMRDLVKDGYLPEDARDFSIVGCAEPTGSGNNNGYTSAQSIRMPSMIEATLNEGCLAIAGWKRVGAPTPPASEFKTFEDAQSAFEEQVSYAVDLCARKAYVKDQIAAERYPVPLLSSTIEGCIETGRDLTRGGARYNHGSVSAQSVATVADSLAAIKWAVFDKKLISMADLMKHLRNNFEGAEETRQLLLSAPKYGNDEPYVDEIARWVADVYDRETRKRKFWMGGVHRSCLISVSGTQRLEGALIGATPDGRQSGAPVSIGMSPVDRSVRNGLTATLGSGAVVSAATISDGTSLTLNLNPTTIRTDEGLRKFESTIEAYFAMGGRQVQFNPVSKEILSDAQEYPEKYPDLVVKVSGYSWRFVDLAKPLQDEIIGRFEFS
jgi:formate C-acetyltransferase